MAQWPPFQVVDIDEDDLGTWPSRVEVGPLDLVGPTSENQQPTALATRTETLRSALNLLAAMFNEVRAHFLDRDGADPAATLEGGGTSDQGPVWMRGNMDMGGFRIRNLADATAATSLVTVEQLQAIQFTAEDDVEQVLDNIVFKIDGTAVGTAALNAGNNRVFNLDVPVAPGDAARKAQFDASITALRDGLVLRSGGSAMTSNLDLDGPTPADPGFFIRNVADPLANDQLVTKRYLDEQIALVGAEDVPTGAVIPYAGPEGSVPASFLVCDGREVSRFTYQNLFNTIGIAYGTPTNSNLFRLPDLRGRIVVGRDTMSGQPAGRITAGWAANLGGVGGTETHTLTLAQIPVHTHNYDDHLFAEGLLGAIDGGDDGTDADNVYDEVVRTSGPSGSGIAHPNLQPSMTQLWLIRV